MKSLYKFLRLATIAGHVAQQGITSAELGKCAKVNLYQCKSASCGTTVSNCLECDGYLNTDSKHNLCFNRKIFGTHQEKNPDKHYPFLINDIIGIIVWFVAAGVATACGVGGGGIYVPFAIILLRFSSKSATGLSQASIFGASLGGLFLNIRNRHPDEKIRDTIGRRDDNGKVIPYDTDLSTAEARADQQAYLDSGDGRKFYTRPLIDYDMALFLAPMEMAGAVLGVIIQKLLPDWLFLSLAGIILGLTSYKTYTKFFSSYKIDKENRERRRLANVRDETSPVPSTAHDEQMQMQLPVPLSATEENNVEAKQTSLIVQEDPVDDNVALIHEVDKLSQNSTDAQTGEGSGEETILQYIKHRVVRGLDLEGAEAEPEANVEKPKEDAFSHDTNVEEPQQIDVPGHNEPEDDPEKLNRRREILETDMRQYPAEKLVYLLILWIGLAFITFLKGGKGVDSIVGITCSSPWYAVLIALQFAWTFGFAGIFGYKLVKRHEEKVACDYPFHTNDVLWDVDKLRYYAFFTFIAGVVAGLIGIGGGMVLGPLMLILGVHPRVSSATTATMIVLTSSSVAIMFVTSGLVPWEYALVFFCTCLSGAYIGKKYIDSYVKKSGMSSILIGILATIIGFSTVGCFTIVLLNLSKANWCFDGFKPFCDEGEEDGFKCVLTQLMDDLDF